ncbi:MAG: tripartite tricarboxylate transporter permease [Clostridia bacterium]|nr:tripartite tricarboxylate transporter permease [Clostridia bacterium]
MNTSAILQTLSAILVPANMLIMFAGTLVGMVFGAIPGLSGAMAIMLMLPLSYAMDSVTALCFLVCIFVGGCSGSCISAILLGIPGQNASIATCFDGYPMAKKGEVVRAMSVALVANFIGTFPSCFIALILSQVIARFAVKLGPWELFSLCFCAITLVSSLSNGKLAKGFLSAGLGLAVTCVGMAPTDGYARFTFGNYNLLGGFSLLYVMMGIFASRSIILEFAREKKGEKQEPIKVSGFKFPLKDFITNKVNVIRSWIIGLWIGFLPGMGAALSNVAAYAAAKNASKKPEEFGTGIVDGVIAPEVANNASVGGALIPMVALGIPGDTSTAYLLGALTIHGVEAGPLMFTKYPVLSNAIFLAAMFGAIAILITQMLGMRIFPMILNIPKHWLYSAILAACVIGVYANSNNLFSVAMLVVFSLIGLIMGYADLPQAPFALTFVLGKNMETYFRRGMSFADNGILSFFTHPISCAFLVFAIGSMLWPYLKKYLANKKAAKAE